jgi:RNA polymerase sigma-70 factor (ECF subfamily)
MGHALTLLRNREDALDAIQDAFLSAFKALERFDIKRPFYPWLYVILRNRCYSLLESRQRRPESGTETEILEHSAITNHATATQSSTRITELREAIWLLSPQDREVITLKHLDGLSYQELAEQLTITIGTVMSRLYHARQRLRRLLDESNDGPNNESQTDRRQS